MSLCRMILFPRDYWGADYEDLDGKPPLMFQFKNKDVSDHVRASQREQQEAQRIARTILHENKLLRELKHVKPTESGWNIYNHGVWWDPGDKTIEIPEFVIEADGVLHS